MKKTLAHVFYVLLGMLIFSNTFSDTKKPILPISHWVLDNKVQVFFVRRTSLPMLDIEVVFSAGSSLDRSHKGVAKLTNSMIGEGAENLSADQIAHDFDRVGAQFNSFAGRDMAGVTLRTLVDPKYLTPALNTFDSVLLSPTFPAHALNRVKRLQSAEIKVQSQDPSQIAINRMYQLVYKKEPYAHNPLGTLQSVKSLTRNDVNRFYKRYYTGVNAYLILVGDITEAHAKEIAKNLVGGLQTGKPAPVFSQAKIRKKSIVKHITYASKQTSIIIGQVGITRKNPYYMQLMVGNAILGGLPLSSLLYLHVREQRGLAYYASSGFSPLKYRGPFIIALQTKVSNANKALLLVKNIVKNFVENGPTQVQLKAAKENLVGRFPLTLSANSNILGIVANMAFYHRPLNYLDTYIDRVKSVTAGQVKLAFQKTLHLKKMAYVTVGPKLKKKV